MATPGSGRVAGQLPALYATVTWRVTIALYSCPGELYVPQSTKCPGVQRQPLGESMVVPIPGCDDLLLPPPGGRLARYTPYLGPTDNYLSTSGPCYVTL